MRANSWNWIDSDQDIYYRHLHMQIVLVSNDMEPFGQLVSQCINN